MAKKYREPKRGYFLTEIVIVLGIMALFATVAAILASPQITKAKDAKIKEDLIQIRNALTQYYDDTGCFPQSLPACGQDFQKGSVVYFKNFPCSPYGTPYTYQTDSKTCNTWYKVLTNLGNKNDKSIEQIGCANGCGLKCDYNYGITSTNISINQNCPQTPQNKYACTPSGQCTIFADPNISRCPVIFLNDPTCQNKCSDKASQCHDERGKQN
ncbi:MAG: type II secretion system GspH family protein [Patescibacteria group bacterium]|nr:type II secretion system GspH family protein [Patescibacteria group bacterium]